jgi:15-cis-phytoene synthase
VNEQHQSVSPPSAASAVCNQSSPSVIKTCNAILSKHARAFKWASWFLPHETRDNAAVLYAFCRALDDAVDEALNPRAARGALHRITEDVRRSSPQEPINAAFKEISNRLGIDFTYVEHLIDGIASDLGNVRVQDEEELLHYCYRVASTVGLMMCRALGVTDSRGFPYAIDLGIAMQLTNICRDVAEDAANNRVYLPARSLERFGVSQSSLVQGLAEPNGVVSVVSGLLAMAERYYQSADAGMRYIPIRPRLAIFIASRIYRAIGRALIRRYGCNPLYGRVIVPGYEKLFWVCHGLAAWIISLFSRMEPRHEADLHRFLKDFPGADPGGCVLDSVEL